MDWLRALVILIVFVFHCGRFFDTDGWHVKNPTSNEAAQVWTTFLACWMMPLIFVISGASTWYALKGRAVSRFMKDRAFRLLTPLVVGMFTHVAVQVYLEKKTQAGFKGSFLEFYPQYFNGFYPWTGNFAWMGFHLWYLEALFLLTALVLPLLIWLQAQRGEALLRRLDAVASRPWVLLLAAAPMAILFAALNPDTFIGMRSFGGWSLLIYPWFFLYGFLLPGCPKVEAALERNWKQILGFGAVCVLAVLGIWKGVGDPNYPSAYYGWLHALFTLASWSIILGLLGVAKAKLSFNHRRLSAINEAVLPFYALHQTVILVLGYFIVFRPMPDFLKFVIILLLSLAGTLVIYVGLIRPFAVMRALFGMNPEALKVADATPADRPTLLVRG